MLSLVHNHMASMEMAESGIALQITPIIKEHIYKIYDFK